MFVSYRLQEGRGVGRCLLLQNRLCFAPFYLQLVKQWGKKLGCVSLYYIDCAPDSILVIFFFFHTELKKTIGNRSIHYCLMPTHHYVLRVYQWSFSRLQSNFRSTERNFCSIYTRYKSLLWKKSNIDKKLAHKGTRNITVTYVCWNVPPMTPLLTHLQSQTLCWLISDRLPWK